ncbi:CoxG family protein [Arhodomonas sp. SL1]|uniref:CoxG family protein n=1 Tax=Arhodomonas sp. SL1 TaxID=3425691 RepID=UPI003F885A81
MEMNQERELPFDRQTVWDTLNDPEALRACIPGCQGLEQLEADRYEAEVLTKVGPVKARFRGHVSIEDANPPEAYRLRFEGQGGAAGFAKGAASVRLDEMNPEGTRLGYAVEATVGGKLAQVGSRIVNGAARKLADEFFDNMGAYLRGEPVGEPAPDKSKGQGKAAAGAAEGGGEGAESAPAEPSKKKGGWRFWRRGQG